MRAITRERYGGPEILRWGQIPKPEVPDDGLLVRVRAASVNRMDWYSLRGTPYIARAEFGLLRPKTPLLGVDFAGVVEAVGGEVTDLRPGDEVFGGRTGAFAEYVAVRSAVTRKPANVSFEEAAAVPVAGLTALQGLRDHGRLQAGQRVLVNGASGGVGTFAVQIARALGAEVTAVCSTRNVEQARSLGAHRVIDYTREDFTRDDRPYDLLFDVAGNRSWRECRRVLTRDGTLVKAGAPKGSRLLGPLGHIVAVRVAALRASQRVLFFLARLDRADLAALRDLIEAGDVRPVVERRYRLEEAAEALTALGGGHARGKIVLTV